jgi:hypothetical protein
MEMRAEPDFGARRFAMGFRNLLLSEGRHSASSWEAVWIHCRRLAMSLDNVLAVARGDLPLVLIGMGCRCCSWSGAAAFTAHRPALLDRLAGRRNPG